MPLTTYTRVRNASLDSLQGRRRREAWRAHSRARRRGSSEPIAGCSRQPAPSLTERGAATSSRRQATWPATLLVAATSRRPVTTRAPRNETAGAAGSTGRRLQDVGAEASVAFDGNGDRRPQRVAAAGDDGRAPSDASSGDADEVAGRGVGVPRDLGRAGLAGRQRRRQAVEVQDAVGERVGGVEGMSPRRREPDGVRQLDHGRQVGAGPRDGRHDGRRRRVRVGVVRVRGGNGVEVVDLGAGGPDAAAGVHAGGRPAAAPGVVGRRLGAGTGASRARDEAHVLAAAHRAADVQAAPARPSATPATSASSATLTPARHRRRLQQHERHGAARERDRRRPRS